MLVVNHLNRANGKHLSWPLYQWDQYQWVEIRGLSLPSVPEIHFTNVAMSRAIVKQATMDDAGVIVVQVPNSLLQKPYPITAFVCTRDGDAFKSMCQFEIPVKARPQPAEYTYQYCDEVYSFEALENLIKNNIDPAQDAYNKARIEYMSAVSTAEAWQKAAQEAYENYTNAATLLEQTEQSFADVTAMELLWENSAPDSSYDSGYMYFDTTKYAAFLLMRTRKSTPAVGVYNEFLVPDSTITQRHGFYCGGYYYSRNVKVNPNNIWISVCTMEDDDGNLKTNDDGNNATAPECCVPVRIYGLRHWPKE